MSDRPHRLWAGPRFSEGARLLWLALDACRWTREDLRRTLAVTSAAVGRWLHGDRLPSRGLAMRLHALFEIPIVAWDAPPSEPFVLPAMRERRLDEDRAFAALLERINAMGDACNDEREPLDWLEPEADPLREAG